MSVLFLFCMLYMVLQISNWIDRVRARKRMREARTQEKPMETVIDVVGKSTTAFFAPLPPETIEPLMSEALELVMVSSAETEPDINPDNVEATLTNPFISDDDELEQYRNDDVDLTGDFSQGLTYQQISQAIDVVHGKKVGEPEEVAAGETFSFMPSDFLDMICAQAEHESVVKRLISCYVDSVGKVKPKTALVENFDINKYV